MNPNFKNNQRLEEDISFKGLQTENLQTGPTFKENIHEVKVDDHTENQDGGTISQESS